MKTLKRGPWILKVVVAVVLVFGALGFTKPAAAYRECTSQEYQYCSQFSGPAVTCGPYQQYFSNSCFAHCSGFTNCQEGLQ
jgi:hypothetical protein